MNSIESNKPLRIDQPPHSWIIENSNTILYSIFAGAFVLLVGTGIWRWNQNKRIKNLVTATYPPLTRKTRPLFPKEDLIDLSNSDLGNRKKTVITELEEAFPELEYKKGLKRFRSFFKELEKTVLVSKKTQLQNHKEFIQSLFVLKTLKLLKLNPSDAKSRVKPQSEIIEQLAIQKESFDDLLNQVRTYCFSLKFLLNETFSRSTVFSEEDDQKSNSLVAPSKEIVVKKIFKHVSSLEQRNFVFSENSKEILETYEILMDLYLISNPEISTESQDSKTKTYPIFKLTPQTDL